MAKKSNIQDWKQLRDKGLSLISEGEGCVDKAAQALMKDKGFKHWDKFGATMVGGGETIITFSGYCEMADLDLEYADTMTKDQIIERLSREIDDENTLNLLIE